MIFRDDECRVRTDNAPFNLAIVKHIALNVLRTGKAKNSLRMRRKVAACDENALAAYIAAKAIGKDLGVRYVLEGSVQPSLASGNQVRLNAQLIDADSGAHVWAQQFDTPALMCCRCRTRSSPI